jgi:putative membrane protein
MKSSKLMFIQILGRGILASALLTACAVNAAEPSPETPASNPNQKGSGASRLSGNSESEPAGSKSYETSSQARSSQPITAQSFLKDALEGNSAEVALAQVAERKAQSQELKQFAQTLRKDHQQANQQLQPIAQAHGVTVNQSLDTKHQKKLERFQQMSGSEFDKEYAKDMLKDHQKDISLYERAAQLTETDVQQYAQKTLPTLRQHLQHAQQTAVAVGVDQATISAILKQSPDAMGGTSENQDRESGSSSDSPKPRSNIQAPQGTTTTP